MSLSGMVEIPRRQAKRGFVMPAKAGIHLRFRWQAEEDLDSGLRRNDERKSRLLVDEFRTARLGAEPRSVAVMSPPLSSYPL
jgi:hypothetical protein